MDAGVKPRAPAERALASVRAISSVEPIARMDRIESVHIDGWSSVVPKGMFKAGDVVVFCQTDAFMPDELAPAVMERTVFEGKRGHRVRTGKVGGAVSEGIVLPLPESMRHLPIGSNVTDALGIVKWEKPQRPTRAAAAAARADGRSEPALRPFPEDLVPRTDQLRFQEIPAEQLFGESPYTDDCGFEMTRKMDGSSTTVLFDPASCEVRVCSRNREILDPKGSAQWRAAEAQGWIRALTAARRPWALQGEIIGPTIQNNFEKVGSDRLCLFDIYDIEARRYLTPTERRVAVHQLESEHGADLAHVPVLHTNFTLRDVGGYAALAAAVEAITGGDAEGAVFKHCERSGVSFKVINRSYLIARRGGEGDDDDHEEGPDA